MTVASTAAQQNAAVSAANAAAAGLTGVAGASSGASASASSSSSATALTSLSSNYSDFLKMLMTQLQNQDPTNPMDTSQFTSQLVQFASVEQQINTNNNLTQLIQATQGSELIQGSAIVGQSVTATSSTLPLQNGSASLTFTAPTAEPVAIAVYSSSGTKIVDAVVSAAAGENTWTWNGQNATGTQMADGAYKVAVEGANSDGTATALPFTVTGTATGITADSSGVNVQLGPVSVGFGSITSVAKQ
ncbi:MAG: flagellar hook assembly protein FlgD [Proteobacteria bacterium]|nr:flagellar hook assembly protein FlgD [Pseudomonadota bacterium]